MDQEALKNTAVRGSNDFATMVTSFSISIGLYSSISRVIAFHFFTAHLYFFFELATSSLLVF